MSEFNKLSKDVLIEREKYNTYSLRLQSGNTSKELEAVLVEMKASLSKTSTIYKPLAEKFLSKIDSKDPISGNPRYGDKMRLRIRELNEEIDSLMTLLIEVVQITEERYVTVKEQETQDIIVQSVDDKPVPDAIEDVATPSLEPSIDLDKLHQEAEALRLRKRKRNDAKTKVAW